MPIDGWKSVGKSKLLTCNKKILHMNLFSTTEANVKLCTKLKIFIWKFWGNFVIIS